MLIQSSVLSNHSQDKVSCGTTIPLHTNRTDSLRWVQEVTSRRWMVSLLLRSSPKMLEVGNVCLPMPFSVGMEPAYNQFSSRKGWKPDSVLELWHFSLRLGLDPEAQRSKACSLMLHCFALMSAWPLIYYRLATVTKLAQAFPCLTGTLGAFSPNVVQCVRRE